MRIHVMRPTRHYVAAEDIRWTLKLSSRRIITANHSFAKSREQDISVDIVGGRSGSYEEVLRQAKDTALREMQDQAALLGANAVVGVDLDYETVGDSGSMLMVTASGTAVRIED